MTTPSRSLKELFLAALEVAPAERAAWLERECADDAGLRQHLGLMLAAHDAPQSLLDRPGAAGPLGGARPSGDGAPTIDQPMSEVPGTVIGPYKLLQQIGEGGMGTVFMAEQTEPVKRKVALKILKPGLDTRQVIARFEAERQALAMMDHVNIARVFDGGTTACSRSRETSDAIGTACSRSRETSDAIGTLTSSATGRPYFVMELVHGVPITRYCDDNHLTPRERLELFVPVCQAIQHAHQKGIIHRDIKPSNVMVTLYDGKPVPKVIDFGVAKATEQKLTERTLFTQYGTMVGTLEYMSPEQAEMSALGVDTRSDIYSLGVLLYELLTGNTPLDRKRMKEAAFGEILRIIKEEEPPRPSTRLSDSGAALASISEQRHMEPAKLTKLVRGELDWIVMKALEKDRNRRYETANGFARDVERYLADEPVQACPPSAAYRFRKFARRNKGALTMAAVITVALVVGSAISTWQAIRATRAEALAGTRLEAEEAARREAVANLEKARQAVDEYFVQVSETDLLNVPGLQPLRKELLETALRYYQDILERSGNDPQLRADLAKTYSRVAVITRAVGSLTKAVEIHQKALALWQRLAEENPAAAEYQAELGIAHIEIGFTQGGLRQSREALASFQQAVAVLEKLVAAHPDRADFRNRLARACVNLGAMQGTLRAGADTEEEKSRLAAAALSRHRQALEIREALVRSHPEVHEYKRALARGHDNIGQLHRETRDHEEALRAHERALEIWDELARLSPGNLHYESERGRNHNYIGDIQRDVEDWDGAVRSYERAIELEQRLLRRSPAVTTYQRQLINSLHNLTQVYRQTGKTEAALGLYPPMLDLLERLLFPDFAEGELKMLVETYCRLMAGHDKAKAAGEALRVGERATAFLRDLAREQPTVTAVKAGLARVHAAVGDIQIGSKNVNEALRAYAQATAILEELVRAFPEARDHRMELAQVCYKRGRQHTFRKQHEVAVPLLARTIELHPDHAQACNYLAWTYVMGPEKLRDPRKALPLAQKAVELNPGEAGYLAILGVVHYRLGGFKEAEDCLVRAGELRPERPDAFERLFLAMIHQRQGNPDKARACYDEAMQTWNSGLKLRGAVWHEGLEGCRVEAEKLLGLKSP